MNIAEIKEYLLDFQKKELPELVNRELKIEHSKKIKSVIGPRRAGKTYFMYQEMKKALKAGKKKENILFLNFEDPRLIDINFKEIREIIKLHWQLYPKSNPSIFIDEPQNINKWELGVRALYDEGFDLYLSGSSSKLLSKEIATSLRGRTLSYLILPFSFKEFLKMKKSIFDISTLSSKEKSILLSFLDEYLEFGGFPEVILEENKENKIKTLKEYLDMIIYKDIVERYNVKNTKLIKWLINSLITSFSKEFSVHKIYLTLKSKGVKVSKNTLYSYLSMLEDSFFAFFAQKFNYSIRNREFSVDKAYLCDIGFAKLLEVSRDKGKKMENAVFLELERKKKSLTEIACWKNAQQEEVDFVVKQGRKVRQIIQVCCNIEDLDAKKREIRALIKASKELKCKDLLVITEDKEGEEITKKKKIKYIPLWKWLLR